MTSQANTLPWDLRPTKLHRSSEPERVWPFHKLCVPELIREIMRGFNYPSLIAFESNSGLSLQKLADLVGIPERTLARRKASGRLAPEESERRQCFRGRELATSAPESILTLFNWKAG